MLKISKVIRHTLVSIIITIVIYSNIPITYVYAQPVSVQYPSCEWTSIGTPIEGCIMAINRDIMGILIAVVVVISVFMLPYIVLSMTSGDPQKIQAGKEALFAWITGFLLIVFSGIIIVIVLREMLLVGA